MSSLEYEAVLQLIRDNSFSSFQCIDLLRRYYDNIGVHHVLVERLYTFTYDELEFFIPQFVQLLVSFETNSMALEDFLFDYCSKYPHFSMVVFWYLQAYVFELRNDPDSYSFHTVRKFINKLQNIMFNTETSKSRNEVFSENLHPALILCGAIGSLVAMPSINDYIAPLIRSQAKQQKSFVFKLANFQKTLTRNLTIKNSRISNEVENSPKSDEENVSLGVNRQSQESSHSNTSNSRSIRKDSLHLFSDESDFYTTDEETELKKLEQVQLLKEVNNIKLEGNMLLEAKIKEIEGNLRINTIIKSRRTPKSSNINTGHAFLGSSDLYNVGSKSLPDLSKTKSNNRPYLTPTESESTISIPYTPYNEETEFKQRNEPRIPSYSDSVKILHANYAKNETEFIMALQNISIRLSQVPKEARLSALRAELSIINDQLLPSEVDVPQLLPITSNRNKKYHKILRLSVNEACVLNSAERVPFLLLIEYLSDEFDFNPFSEYNQKIIANRGNSVTEPRYTPNEILKSVEDDLKLSSGLKPIESLGGSPKPELEMDLTDLPTSTANKERFESHTKVFQALNYESKSLSPSATNVVGDISARALTDQMRIASVMLQQLESSGQSTSEQSMAIKSRIIQSMISLQDQFDSIDYEKLNQLKGDKPDAGQRKLENDFKLGEDWNLKKQRIRKSSVYGHLKGWELCSVIAKNGDDLPQEAFACQLISLISSIWKKHETGAWVKRMKILITSANTGLVETITDAMSIHSIKKSLTEISISEGENVKGRIFTLHDYFLKMYGSPNSRKYKERQENFARSLASYSIICYVLQIKDRHNGNIMLDNDGHIIHIDFGFLLSNSPGSVGFEAAPFKLTSEYVELMGGVDSVFYKLFKDVCKRCFAALRFEANQIINIVELMQKDSTLPCFKNGDNTSVLLKQRLQLQLSDEDVDSYVENALIGKSLGSMYTRLYDQFQMVTQGIYS